MHRKVFYRWFNGYFTSLEHSYRPYTSTLKRKVLRTLLQNLRNRDIQRRRARQKFESNMYFKVWLCLLRHLNEGKEEKAKEEAEAHAREMAREEKPMVNIKPHIDKILPEDIAKYHESR